MSAQCIALSITQRLCFFSEPWIGYVEKAFNHICIWSEWKSSKRWLANIWLDVCFWFPHCFKSFQCYIGNRRWPLNRDANIHKNPKDKCNLDKNTESMLNVVIYFICACVLNAYRHVLIYRKAIHSCFVLCGSQTSVHDMCVYKYYSNSIPCGKKKSSAFADVCSQHICWLTVVRIHWGYCFFMFMMWDSARAAK